MAHELLTPRDLANSELRKALAQSRSFVPEPAAKEVIRAYGVDVPRGVLVLTPAEASAAAEHIGFPVVLKLVSPEILHKSEAGGVEVGLSSTSEVGRAAQEMAKRCATHGWRLEGLLIEQMIARSHELVVGGIVDQRFGPMLMVGLGGIFVEVFEDVALAVCPIDSAQARRMIRRLRSAPVFLQGERGGIRGSESALIEVLLAVGGRDGLLIENLDLIESVDINPLFLNADRAVAADARIVLRREPAPALEPPAVPADFSALFEPQSIAVAGASATRVTFGNVFIRRLREYGYEGAIYPIHPRAPAIEGLPTYKSLGATPRPIDYVYIAVPPDQVPDLIAGANGRVRFAQIISSGFGEVEEGHARQRRLEEALDGSGVRVLGPNSLGTHSPRGHVTYLEHVSTQRGAVGVVSQSGGLSIDIARRGRGMGIEFSGIVTVGNSIDIGPADLVEHYFHDPETRVVGVYVEDVKDGRRFFDALLANRGGKPVVLLVGGRTAAGRRAANSHTGALASDTRVWEALAQQTGAVLVDTLDEFLESLLAFQLLPPHVDRPTRQVVLFGNGGGASVLATDYFARRGLEIGPLPSRTIEALEAIQLPPGSSVVNPIDTPAGTLRQEDGRVAKRIIEAVFSTAAPDAFVMHLNLPAIISFTDKRTDILGNLMEAALEVLSNYPHTHFLLVLRSTGEPELDERRRVETKRAASMGIPVYFELESAAHALAALAFHETCSISSSNA